jgi:class 3 adenylate cyclase
VANQPGELFCGECGTSLAATVSPPHPSPTPSPSLPTSFASGRYQVQRFLGEGGKKRVFLARDARLDRDVALALIKTEGLDAEGLARVCREAQAMGRLGDHPHIVTVHDIGEERGQPFIVSQYMAGGSVEDLLQRAGGHRLPIDQALRIADQVCMALEHAHSCRVIHRDLKPGNVWLTADPSTVSGPVVKLGDFGLAVALDRPRLTVEGMMVGTVAYMPPEQALGRPPDARSDLYSLGAMLYEMVTGRPPFLGDDAVAVISQHINTAPVAPSWHNPEVPRALEALTLRLLAKAPEDRPESAAAVRQALSAIASTASTVAERIQEVANPLDRLAGGVFVGREKEMDELRAALEDALAGKGRLLMLVGEPGIGKTRTADELATYARLRNAQVLWGRCYEGEGAPAYWPWIQVIRSHVHDRDPAKLLSEMGPGAADIAQVVSEVRERLPGLPTPPSLEPEQARFRLFDSITTFLKNAGQGQPLVLVLDDLHWADKPSLLLLQFLVRDMRGARLLCVGTYRDIELGRQHPLAQTLAELAREQLSQRILLRGLTARDVGRFIELTAGLSPPAALVKALYRETEGNPFFMNEIVRLLVSEGRLERPDEVKSWSVTIPQSVREVVGRRLDHLSEECNRVLTVASVIGREFGLDVLQRVTDASDDSLLELLEEAIGARVVAEVPRTVGRYGFTHALIRETLYEELGRTRRIRLHRQIGGALEALYQSKVEPHLAELAYHFFEGAQGGDDDKAVTYAERAGQRAMSLLAYEEAAAHYDRALQALELRDPPDDVRGCELLLALGESYWKGGESAKAKDAFLRAAAVARKLASAEHLARVALGFGATWVPLGTVDESLVCVLEEALAALGKEDSALRARLLSRLARALYFSPEREHLLAVSREAVETARRVAEPRALAEALTARHWVISGPYDLQERLDAASELIRLARELGDRESILEAHSRRVTDLIQLGDLAATDRELEAAVPLARETRQPLYLWFEAVFRAMRALLEGRFDEGEQLAQQALAIGHRATGENALQVFGVQILAARWGQGRLEELEPAFKGLAGQYPTIPAFRSALAFLYAELGRPEEARREFELAAANDFADIPLDTSWLIAIALLSDVCVFLGDARRAGILYDLLLPCADRNVVAAEAAVCNGSASRQLGVLATALERWEQAELHFKEALKSNAGMRARPFVARTLYEYAGMLLARSAAGDRERALDLLNKALDASRQLGMKSLLEKTLALKLEAQGATYIRAKTSIDAVASAVYVETPDLRAHAAPDGTVTLLFTDIEGSTAMTERLGDQRWLELLRSHNAIVRQQTQAHDGFEVKSQGDGFMLAFQGARKALQCAIDIQRAFAADNEEAEEPIRVRIGLHTGEAIKEGEDFFGKHVNLAARVAGQAQGGKILVSALLKELTESAGEFAFGKAQEVKLKGLKEKQRVYEVMW